MGKDDSGAFNPRGHGGTRLPRSNWRARRLPWLRGRRGWRRVQRVVGVLIDTHHRYAHPQPRPRGRAVCRAARAWEPRARGPRAVAAAPLVCHLCSASGLGLGSAPPDARSPRKCSNRAGALASQVPYPRVAHHGPWRPWGQGRVCGTSRCFMSPSTRVATSTWSRWLRRDRANEGRR